MGENLLTLRDREVSGGVHPLPSSRGMSIRCDGRLRIRLLTVDACRSIWFDQPPTEVADIPDGAAPSAVDTDVICEADRLIPDWYAAHATVSGKNIYMHKFGAGAAAILADSLGDFTFSADVILRGEGIADVLFRLRDVSNYYCLRIDGIAGRIVLFRKVGGESKEIASRPHRISVNTPCCLRLQVVGNVVEAHFDNTCVLRASDGTFAAGQLGLNVHTADAEFQGVWFSAVVWRTVSIKIYRGVPIGTARFRFPYRISLNLP